MMIRTALTEKARAELIAFCGDNLKAGLDPVRYADALEAEADFSAENLVFEVAARDAARGNAATISFDQTADFQGEQVED